MARVLIGCVCAVSVFVGCSGSDGASREEILAIDEPPVDIEPAPRPSYVDDVIAAIEAVDAELGGPQQFFEVTANAQFTNIFVAVDDASAAVPYLFVDGELQPPAPKVDGAEGDTFTLDDVDFDPERVVGIAQAQLPEADVDALSVYGTAIGATYVLSATSRTGGILDIVVGPDGSVLSVEPV